MPWIEVPMEEQQLQSGIVHLCLMQTPCHPRREHGMTSFKKCNHDLRLRALLNVALSDLSQGKTV